MKTSVRFGDLISAGLLEIGDGYRAKNSELGGEGPLFLRAAMLTASGFEWDGEHFRDSSDSALRAKMGRPGDTVVTTKGNGVGRTGYVPDDAPPFVYSPHLCFWRSGDHARIDPGYLRYWAQGQEFRRQLRGLAYGTDMAPYLSLADQKRLEITLPPIADQRAISSALGAIDDKVESNDRAAKGAMALARLRFEQLSDSAQKACLGDVATVVLGGTPNRSVPEYWLDGSIPWVNSGAANRDIIVKPTELITESGLAHSSAKLMPRGATVVAITGATLGQVALLGIATTGNQSLVGVWAPEESVTTWLHFAVSACIPELLGHATGAAQQHVNKGDIAQMQVSIPADRGLNAWSETGLPLVELAMHLVQENQRLVGLRESLLPVLLSGRLRMRDAQAELQVSS